MTATREITWTLKNGKNMVARISATAGRVERWIDDEVDGHVILDEAIIEILADGMMVSHCRLDRVTERNPNSNIVDLIHSDDPVDRMVFERSIAAAPIEEAIRQVIAEVVA